MNKITLTSITMLALGTIFFALPALAATTASITPASVKVVAGQQFNVVIAVNPNGTSDYAEQVKIDYPADLLQVTSFNIGSSWMSLTEAGYDSIDNVNGILTKTAGYAGGITSLTPFGTVTFTALKAGSGAIAIGSGSQAFEKSGQTAITGTGASFVITVAAVAPVVTPKAPATTDLTPVTTVNGQVVATTSAQEAVAAVAASQVAAANTAASGVSGSTWVWILVIVLIILIIGAVYLVSKRKKKF
jgi:peptide methionine sulfoxide reductase MsrA